MFTALKALWANKRLLADLGDRLETLERDQKALELEWIDMYDKLRHMMSRVAKRADRAERALGATNGEGPDLDTPLHPDPISEAVWARRRRGRMEGTKP